MIVTLRILVALLATAAAQPALAHPHVFIDATVEVIFDAEGRASALRIGWTYDDLFSMMIVEDRGLDPDYDGILTDESVTALSGFDMQWDPGFPGDTYPLLDGQPLMLGPPQEWTASHDGMRITSTHVRPFVTPVEVGDVPLVVQVYDPSFYTSYVITGTPELTGRDDCTVQVFEPDRAAADDILMAAIAEMAGSADMEGEFPAVGAAYAEEARVTCGG
jgi:polyphosphate kinase